jgi:exopolyphosphatase/pppGpp-phosphohydrolase
MKLAVEKQVDILYTVATAAYRTANNRNEIIELIKNECGINVKILSKKEEAIATLTGFIFCKDESVKIDPTLNYLMIDQGGGSTELSLFRSNEIIDTYSLNLGTSILKNVLFKEATNNSVITKGLRDSDKFIKDRLRTYFSNPKSSLRSYGATENARGNHGRLYAN